MSFIHYLFLGHFEHEGEVVRFSKSPNAPVYRPVIQRPLDTEVIKEVVQMVQRSEIQNHTLPEDWNIWFEEGYLVCDKYMKNREAINFVARLVERSHCEIHDVSAHCDITLRDWLDVANSYAKP